MAVSMSSKVEPLKYKYATMIIIQVTILSLKADPFHHCLQVLTNIQIVY